MKKFDRTKVAWICGNRKFVYFWKSTVRGTHTIKQAGHSQSVKCVGVFVLSSATPAPVAPPDL